MSSENDEAKSLAVQMSKLNVYAQEFVPGPAMISNSEAGPSGLCCPDYYAAGPSSSYTGLQFPVLDKCVERPPEEPIPVPGPSSSYTGLQLPVLDKCVERPPEEPIPVPGPSTNKKPNESQKKRRKLEENFHKDKSISKKKFTEKRSLKEHVNIILVGHVDAGKSTIGGQIMSLTGMVDDRTLDKYLAEAREKSRESWYLSWALDTNQEERDRGKTVEVGRAYFETVKKHFTILDAPGHKCFVPNMIGGAAQADYAALVVSARKGEFETGFEKAGQTREHTLLVKTAGVKHLVVLINKMDDLTVNWDENRYNYCVEKILPFLKPLGFNIDKNLSFLPVSGQTGQGLLEKLSEEVCPWYSGPSFIQLLDELPSINRCIDGPFIMPIVDKYKDMGIIVMGKVESGQTFKGKTLIIMPNKIQVIVDQLWSDNLDVSSVACGENVKLKLKGIEEEEVSLGFVLCDVSQPVSTGKIFDAHVSIVETKSIITAGFSAVMHIHSVVEEVSIKLIISLVDRKNGGKTQTRPRFVKDGQEAIMRIECSGTICIATYKTFPPLSRFTIRDENKTIAFGKVLKVIK